MSALHISDSGVLSMHGNEINPKIIHALVEPKLCRDLSPKSRLGTASFLFNGRMYVFGGSGGAMGSNVTNMLCSIGIKSTLDETGWAYEKCCSENRSEGPSPRCECTAVLVPPRGSTAYIFGGMGGPNYDTRRDVFDDVWALNMKTLSWRQVTPSPDFLPSGRRGHTAVSTENGLMIVFGGIELDRSFACENYSNSTWCLDVETNKWHETSHNLGDAIPSPRAYHTATIICTNRNSKTDRQAYRMVVIGGTGANLRSTATGPQIQMASVGESSFASDDVYILSVNRCTGNDGNTTTTYKWSCPEVQGESCGGRYGHTAVPVKHGKSTNIIVYGGRTKKGGVFGASVFCLNVGSPEVCSWHWSKAILEGSAVLQGPRFMHTAVAASDRLMVVFGGCKLNPSDPGFCKGDAYFFKTRFRHVQESKYGNVCDEKKLSVASKISSLGLANTSNKPQAPQNRCDGLLSTRRLLSIQNRRSTALRTIQGLRELHRKSSRDIKPRVAPPLACTQRELGLRGLPPNMQGIKAALNRREDIANSTRSLRSFPLSESAPIFDISKPKLRNISTIGFNNRRIKIGLGRIRSPFCLKTGMYGFNSSERYSKTRPVSAPRNRRDAGFTRSNVFTQDARNGGNSHRPKSAMPSLSSSYRPRDLYNESRISLQNSLAENRRRPQSALQKHGRHPSLTKLKQRPASAQVRRTAK